MNAELAVGRGVDRQRQRKRAMRSLVVGLALVSMARLASSAVIVVEGGCTLHDAIRAANTDTAVGACTAGVGADEVRLSEDVRLKVIDNRTDGPNGLPSVTSEIEIAGGGFAIERLAGSPRFRLLHVSAEGSLTLRDVTLRGGDADAFDGGALFSDDGFLTISDAAFHDNTTQSSGGAIYSTRYGTITNSTLSGNTAGDAGGAIAWMGGPELAVLTVVDNRADHGGGVYTTGSPFVIDSVIADNLATEVGGGLHFGPFGPTDRPMIYDTLIAANRAGSGGGLYTDRTTSLRGVEIDRNSAAGQGGGVFAREELILRNTTVTGNSAESGGGIYSYDGPLEVYESRISDNLATTGGGIIAGRAAFFYATTLSDNFADGFGGAFYSDCGCDGHEVRFNGCTLSGNSAVRGGAIYNDAVDLTIVNSTFSDNLGGAIYQLEEGSLNVRYCTFSGNTGGFGAAIRSELEVELSNSIVANSFLGASCEAPIVDGGGNFNDDGSCPGSPIVPFVDFDPVLAAHGGATESHRLVAGSVALDAGGECELETDQRDRLRTDACDSGSFELGAPPPLEIRGACPTNMSATLAGAVPGGRVLVATSPERGRSVVPSGPCAGTELDLAAPTLTWIRTASTAGRLDTSGETIAGSLCGLLVQAVDETTCSASTLATVPLARAD